jgi:hypothetical protein
LTVAVGGPVILIPCQLLRKNNTQNLKIYWKDYKVKIKKRPRQETGNEIERTATYYPTFNP